MMMNEQCPGLIDKPVELSRGADFYSVDVRGSFSEGKSNLDFSGFVIPSRSSCANFILSVLANDMM